MNVFNSRLKQLVGLGVMMFLIAPTWVIAAPLVLGPVQQSGQSSQSPAPAPEQQAEGAQAGSGQNSAADKGGAAVESASQEQPSPAPQNTQTLPAGTAAAPYEKQEGVSASKPAGAAIAPGKQRRIHSFAIRAGLLIGAAIAIGVVTAASLGSPSRSPQSASALK